MKMLLIVDGGTTNLRVTAVDAQSHAVLASIRKDGGVRNTAVEGNSMRLRELLRSGIKEVLTQTHEDFTNVERCIAFGMITSGAGLMEIPHLSAPAGRA